MIVDDERFIRNLLKKSVAWENLGIKIVGEAENAEKGLPILERLRPHIVITDICMAEMDGISFSAEAKKRCPEVKIVVLTGYEEFEYAQRSIEAGVSAFLLKPIDPREIKKTMERLKEQIRSESEKREELNKLRAKSTDEPQQKAHMSGCRPVVTELLGDYIMKNLSCHDLSLSDLSREAHLSTGYLSRLFKQEFGVSFVRYLLCVRIEKAKELMQDGSLPFYQVGELVGIPDPHYFSICFKKQTGIAPADYRKSLIKGKGVREHEECQNKEKD